MLDNDIEITKQITDVKYNRAGEATYQIRVEFFVQKHGPFAERFDREGFTADARDQRLNAFAREVRTPAR